MLLGSGHYDDTLIVDVANTHHIDVVVRVLLVLPLVGGVLDIVMGGVERVISIYLVVVVCKVLGRFHYTLPLMSVCSCLLN